MILSRRDILQKYGVSPESRIGGGMEAEVYAFNRQTVLKLYPDSHHLQHLGILMDFYFSLETGALPYRLPCIRTLAAEGDFCLTLEDRLPGEVLSAHLPQEAAASRNCLSGGMEARMEQYLDAVLALRLLPVPAGTNRHLLFDAEGFSRFEHGDWHAFLKTFLRRRLMNAAACLRRDVLDFDHRLAHLEELLSQPYTGSLGVIHGDFFPGNLLAESDHQIETPGSPAGASIPKISALLDFGLFTMIGDPLFDLATAWVFFDMYDDLGINARAHLLARIVTRLGESIRGRLYRYVLIYSLLSANIYAPDCSDGHYRWCVENLNHPTYWDGMA